MLTPKAAGATRTLALWGPVVAYMAVIFYVSSLPTAPLPPGISDEQGHSFGYAGLGVLMLRAVARGERTRVGWRTVALAIVLTTVYGMSDELHQSLVPGREADAHDIIADALGAAIGAGLVWTWGILSAVRTRAHTR